MSTVESEKGRTVRHKAGNTNWSHHLGVMGESLTRAPSTMLCSVVPSYFLILSKPLKHTTHKTQSWELLQSARPKSVGWFNDSDVLLMRKANELEKSHLKEQGQPQSTRPLHRWWYLVWIWTQRWFSGLYFFFFFFSVCHCFVCMFRNFFLNY